MSKILGPFGIMFKDESSNSNLWFSFMPKSEKHPFGKLYCCYFYFDEVNGWSMTKMRWKKNTLIPDANSELLKRHTQPLPAKLPILYANDIKNDQTPCCFVFDAYRIHVFKAMYDDVSTKYDGVRHAWTYDPQSTEHHVQAPVTPEPFKLTEADLYAQIYQKPIFDFSPEKTFKEWQNNKIKTLSEPDRISNIIDVRRGANFKHETLKDDIVHLKADPIRLETVAQIYFSNNLNALNNFLNILTIMIDARPNKDLDQEQAAELWKCIRTRDDIFYMFFDFIALNRDIPRSVCLTIPVKQVAPFVAYEPQKQRLRKLYDFGADREPTELTEILNAISDKEIVIMIQSDADNLDRHRHLPDFSLHLRSTHEQLKTWILSKLTIERRATIQAELDDEKKDEEEASCNTYTA